MSSECTNQYDQISRLYSYYLLKFTKIRTQQTKRWFINTLFITFCLINNNNNNLRRILKMMPVNIIQTLPVTLQNHYLNQLSFSKRFQPNHQNEDPYGRVYDISDDNETQKRVAVRSYTALEPEQQHDVLENMQSFRKLGDEEGMCKLIAFTKKQQGGIISAAFEYNDFSIQELLVSRQYEKERYQLYLLILKEMVEIISSANLTGIVIQQIIPSCILLHSVGNDFHLKILYDQRQKRYDKIMEGIKVFASPEKILTVLNYQRDYQSEECQQAVFQLGLLLLDFMYELQMRACNPIDESIFLKDLPIQRNNLSYKSYLLFRDSKTVELNKLIIQQKINFLNSRNIAYITQLGELIKKMIEPVEERISFDDLQNEVQQFNELMLQAVKNGYKNSISIDQNTFVTPGKQSIDLENQMINRNTNKKEEQNQHNFGNNNGGKNVISQTTIASPHYTSTTDNPPKHFQHISDTKVIQIVIPREPLLSKASKCAYLLPKFQDFISKLQDKMGIVKKQYLDGNVYYGCINSNNKRDGYGIYIYNTNDIYFGIWKDNSLIDGNYLFQNGESFQGIVKNGKQGYGKYHYANGNTYEGEWRDDVKNGTGRMKYPNGDIYEGMWSKGKKNGQGKYYYYNGTVYAGNFVDGKKNGFGVITFPNGTTVEAYWNQTHIEGPGKVFYSNGNFFQGNYHLSQKQGKGYYKWEDANYEGEFKKDLMQGQACIRFSDKQFYNGHIKNGKRDGKGFYQYSNSDQFNGDWRNDQKVFGHYKFHQGGSFDGRFKNNEMSYGVMTYQNGQSYEGQFLKGERHGLGVYKGVKNDILYQGKWQQDQFIAPL